ISMSNDVAIQVENVSKKYCRSLRRSVLYGMADIGRNLLGLGSQPEKLRNNEFWAVNDVSFELKRGETLGLIGPNGSGKTTLLKMLNGIFWPDRGKITIRGRVGALIAVGAGFHPMLSGRDNIYVNGAILGMSKREIDKRFDAIVDFADIGDFLDAPVKHYSSGMFVRLGFAVAVHCDPDILLIDEVLAVGDEGFRAKCYNKIAELQEHCAIILVAHNMSAIQRTCSRCLVLGEGRELHGGDVETAIQSYYAFFKEETRPIHSEGVSLSKFEICAPKESQTAVVEANCDLEIVFGVEAERTFENVIVMLHLLSPGGELTAEWNSAINDTTVNLDKGQQSFRVRLANLRLAPRTYYVSILITTTNQLRHLLWAHQHWSLKVIGFPPGNAAYEVAGSIEPVTEQARVAIGSDGMRLA
ncbi:MAG: ABC transporter ATP-binding protein, partial [Anaerolineae bacterium]|nr:ABC transporter ATP-binding protein [Anaerolineae bacterium]